MKENKFKILKPLIGDNWYNALKDRITDDIFDKMKIAKADYNNTLCYPEVNDIFRAFKETSYDDVKVVILGQDPYHDGNATGLAFDCKVKTSPSMQSIQEAYNDYDPTHFNTDIIDGNLEPWAEQGVLLLNTALTVQKGKPNSHAKYWIDFTIEVVKAIDNKNSVVFMLWGSHAQKFSRFIINNQNNIIKCEHPVASKYKGEKWKHMDCFEVANNILGNKQMIKW